MCFAEGYHLGETPTGDRYVGRNTPGGNPLTKISSLPHCCDSCYVHGKPQGQPRAMPASVTCTSCLFFFLSVWSTSVRANNICTFLVAYSAINIFCSTKNAVKSQFFGCALEWFAPQGVGLWGGSLEMWIWSSESKIEEEGRNLRLFFFLPTPYSLFSSLVINKWTNLIH